jgi:pimeloyl-ACP methyl ester carboxylesterase
MRVRSKGHGPDLVYLHGPWGPTWDPLLDELSGRFTVHAPEHPGTSPGRPDDAYALDGLWDLVLCYDELLSELGVAQATFVGHSFGAMVACEIAAACPAYASRLVLIDALGLWRDDTPIPNWMVMTQADLLGHVFRDASGEAARRMFPEPTDAEAKILARVGLQWAMGVTGKFLWPIPDKGLKKRIHRIRVPTAARLGQGGPDRPAGVRGGVRPAHRRRTRRDGRPGGTRSAGRAAGRRGAARPGLPRWLGRRGSAPSSGSRARSTTLFRSEDRAKLGD